MRVRSAISMPGRFLVLIPFDGKVGVSKKLSNFKEKRRLRKVVRAMLPKGFGAIIRTVADGKTDEMLKQDLDELIKTWQGIEKSVKSEKAPALIYKDMNTTSSVIRDLFQDAVEHVVVDEKKLYKEIRAYVQWMSPDMLNRVEYYRENEPIFDKYGIEKDIQVLLSKKVWLKSGGYLYLEKTEAMTVIDVNSGRYAAKKEQEQNSLRTNLEAAREICRQLRLRDIGGLVVVDFIDLEDDKNKKKIYDEMKKELRRDRAKVTVLPMTEFGLVQITRQRIRQNVQLSFTEGCPMCGGTGLVQSKTSTMNQIERWIKRFKTEKKEFRLQLKVNPLIAEYLSVGTISRLTKLQFKFFIKIKLIPDPMLPADEFKFFSVKQNKEITDHINRARINHMKIFIDTANIDEIREAANMGVLDGVTTNPSLVAKEKKDFRKLLEEICSIVDGPISAEVISLEYDGMMKEARELVKIHKNIVVKIPIIKDGLKAVRALSGEGIRSNVTLCFSANQALLAAKAGAYFISPFIGRLDDSGQNGMDLIGQIVTIYRNYGYTTEVLVASIRHPMHVVDAAMIGADICTMPFKVLDQLIKHPLTDIGIEKFLSDWKKTQGK